MATILATVKSMISWNYHTSLLDEEHCILLWDLNKQILAVLTRDWLTASLTTRSGGLLVHAVHDHADTRVHAGHDHADTRCMLAIITLTRATCWPWSRWHALHAGHDHADTRCMLAMITLTRAAWWPWSRWHALHDGHDHADTSCMLAMITLTRAACWPWSRWHTLHAGHDHADTRCMLAMITLTRSLHTKIRTPSVSTGMRS